MTTEIQFSASGHINQTIDILTDDSPEEFIAKLNKGEYDTTVKGDIIERTKDGKVVGKIIDQDLHTEYFDFEVK